MIQTTPVIKNILYINIFCFLLCILCNVMGFNIVRIFALWNPISDNFFIWQPVTHQFLHGGIFHLLFNMLALLSLGPHVERYIGQKEFLKFYLICGIVAGMFNSIFTETINTPMVGASGAIFGIFSFFAVAFPDEKLYAFFIPYGIRAKFLLGFLIVLEVILALMSDGSDGIGHWAHIGGALCGVIYFKLKIK